MRPFLARNASNEWRSELISSFQSAMFPRNPGSRQVTSGGARELERDTSSGSHDRDRLQQIAFLLQIIVAAIILTFCYFASSFCITVVLSVLLAILIDPLRRALERVFPSRTVAAAASVVLVVALLGAVIFALYRRADSFAAQLPNYSQRIQDALSPLEKRIERLEKGAEDLEPSRATSEPVLKVKETPSWPSFLIRGAGSISGSLAIAVVAPFLAFFMLLRKEQMYVQFNMLFGRTIDTARFTAMLKGMVRGYILGNLIVGAILSGTTVILLLTAGVNNAVPLGILCGFISLIPFFGGILSTAVALAAALLQFSSAGPFIAIGFAVLVLHIFAQNFIIPRWLGPRLLIGPVATTLGILFWGWLWGIMGLLLAVPLTAFIKLAADTHPRLASLSSLLSSESGPVPSWIPFGRPVFKKVRSCIKSLGRQTPR